MDSDSDGISPRVALVLNKGLITVNGRRYMKARMYSCGIAAIC